MTHFQMNFQWFKNNRFVWVLGAPETVSSEDDDVDKESSFAEGLQFIESVWNTCESAKEEGKETIDHFDQQICRIQEGGGKEIIKVKSLVDELGEKFLNSLKGGDLQFQTKDSFERLKLLQEVTDWPVIMNQLKKAESYEVRPYKKSKHPATIIFKYAPNKEHPKGWMVLYPLEISHKEKRDALGRGLGQVWENSIKRKKLQIIDQEMDLDEDQLGEAVDSFNAEDLDKWREQQEQLIEERAEFTTQPEAYEKTNEIAPIFENVCLSENNCLTERLSGPLSRIAEIWSNAEVDYENRYKLIVSESDRTAYKGLDEELISIWKEFYGKDYKKKMKPEELEGLFSIDETFGEN